MPLWKVYHPAGAFPAEDKKALSERVTNLANIYIPKFYVVLIFEELAKDSCFEGGVPHNKFVRFKIDYMARTIPGPIIREWWMKSLDELIAPFVRDKGYDWEIAIDETPVDLWSLQDVSALSTCIRDLKAVDIAERRTKVPAVIAVRVTRLDELRAACEDPAATSVPGPDDPHSVVMHRAVHPSGHKVSLPLPSWYRPSKTKIRWLAHAPSPGADRLAVLADYGFNEEEIGGLAARRITADGWAVLHHYLPH